MKRVAISLFVILLLSLFGCAKPRLVLPHPSTLGFTYCTPAGPGAFINARLIVEGGDVVGTVMHEMKHAEQIRRFPDCKSFAQWAIGNPRVEAEAFCEEVKLETPIYGREKSIIKYGGWLAYGYPHFGIHQLTAESLLREFC